METYMSRCTDDDPGHYEEATFPWLSDAIEARSAENIRIWREYLPDDCIDMMISLGWDQDT
jgi:hypothetical protein